MKSIYVIGCGNLGATIANDLSRRRKDVVVVDSDRSSFALLSEDFGGQQEVADANDLDELRSLGIEEATEVFVTTGNDNLSLFLALSCAKIFHIPYVYVRLDDPTLGILVQNEENIKAVYPFRLTRDRLSQLIYTSAGGDEE